MKTASRTMKCSLCHAKTTGLEDAIRRGWIPSYWHHGKEIQKPACNGCVEHRLILAEDGEYETLGIFTVAKR